MSFRIHISEAEISGEAWQHLVAESPYATFFQTEECLRFYKQLPFLKPFVYAVSSPNNSELLALVCGYVVADGGRAMRYFSRRAIVQGGVLLTDHTPVEAVNQLLHTVRTQLAKQAIFLEIRNSHNYQDWRGLFENNGLQYFPHLNFQIETATDAMAQIGYSRKRDAHASLRNGAEIVGNPTLNEVRQWYMVLASLYHTRVKKPLFPWPFFEALYAKNWTHFFLVRYQQRIVGGTLCVGTQGDTLYEWFACGEDGTHKGIYPSTLATYASIEYAVSAHFQCFDMLGAGQPDKPYGVRDFKRKFGGSLREYGRFQSVFHPVLYAIGRMGIRCMAWMPQLPLHKKNVSLPKYN